MRDLRARSGRRWIRLQGKQALLLLHGVLIMICSCVPWFAHGHPWLRNAPQSTLFFVTFVCVCAFAALDDRVVHGQALGLMLLLLVTSQSGIASSTAV